MAGIQINEAPLEYQRYFKAAKNKSSNINLDSQNSITTKEEAESAATAYCNDQQDQVKCDKMKQYLVLNGFNLEQEIKPDQKLSHRKFRFNATPLVFNLGGGVFNYNSLNQSERYVPPHPDDTNAKTEAINPPDESFFAFQMGFDVNVDFWQYLSLRYKAAWVNTGTYGHEIRPGDYGCRPVPGDGEVCYGGGPAPNRQKYASGQDAYTFLATNADKKSIFPAKQSLTIGFSPFFKLLNPNGIQPGESDHDIKIEAGAVMANFTVARGWDRYASIQIMDNKNITLVGGTWSLRYQVMHEFTSEKTVNFNLGFSIGLTGEHYPGGTSIYTLEATVPFGFSAFEK